jgi:uncharacterized repeat protein (TIGR02543 family)
MKYKNHTPKTSGKYVLYSYGNENTEGYLYDSSGKELARNDDGGSGTNFRITYNLTAGTTYNIGVKYHSSTQTGDIRCYFGPVYTVSYNANSGSGAPSSQEKDYKKDLTLSSSAPSTEKKYTITYNANGGSVSPSSKTVDCTFSKWNTKPDGTGTSYNAGANYTNDADVTLYAQWTNPTAGTLPKPERSDYTFDGWYTASSGGSKITSSSTISANTTLYAHWTPIPVVVAVGCDIVSTPNKTSYIYKESTDTSGTVLNIRYSDGSTKTVSDTSKMTFSGLTTSSVGTKAVTVTCEGVSASFNITVQYAWWQRLIRIFLLGFLWY